MGKFDIDKYFKFRLKKHSEEINTDELWNALDLESQDDDGGVFWLKGLLPLLLVSAIGFYVYYYQSPENVSHQVTANTTLSTVSIKNENKTPTTYKQQSKTSKNLTEQAQTINQLALTHKKEATPTTNTTATKIKQSSQLSNTINNISKRKLTPSKVRAKLIPTTQNSLNTSQSTKLSEPIAFKSFSDNLPVKKSEVADQVSLQERTENLKDAPPFVNLMSDLSAIPVIQRPVIQQTKPSDYILEMTLAQQSIVSEPQPEVQKSKFSLDTYIGYYFLDRNLTSALSGRIDSLVNLRNASEEQLEMISFGAALKYQRPKGIYLSIGLQYQSINESFSTTFTRNDTILADIPVTNYVSSLGDTTIATGLGLAYQAVTTDRVSYNKHSLLNLPLSIGYEINCGVWTVFVEGTGFITLSHSFSGTQFDSEYMVIERPSYFSTNLNGGLCTTIGVSYKLTDNLTLSAQPRFQTYFNSFTSADSGQEQKYKLYGIRAGVNYLLN